MRATSFILLMASAGCIRPVPSVQAELDALISSRAAQPPTRCISRRGDQVLRPIDASTLVYGRGSTIYINHLDGKCAGLRDLSTIIVETSSDHYCRGDRLRALQQGAIIPGPVCSLGDWIPYRSL